MSRDRSGVFRICCIGMMAAMTFASNYVRIPFLGSQIHIGNAVCVMCGLLFGPVAGFLSAGLGNLLFDVLAGYGAESFITFASKGAIAAVAALVIGRTLRKNTLSGADQFRLVLSCALGALTYVALYMLKTVLMGSLALGLSGDGLKLRVLSKLPASLINAAFATIVSPILINAVLKPLKNLGLFKD